MRTQTYGAERVARVYSFDREVYDRAARARLCMPLGLGGCFGGPAHVQTFNGDFSTLFASPYQSVQGNRGIGYASLLDTGGTGPVLTFTGAPTGAPVPVWVKATSGGALGTWQYAVYYDGVGTTPAMTGTSAATIPLTGAGTGLTLNIAAGTATINNVWKATASAWNDQTANAVHSTNGTAAQRPIIGIGFGGMCSLIFSQTRSTYLVSSLTTPAPGTTPRSQYLVFRWLATVAGQQEVCGSGAGVIFSTSGNPAGAGDVRMYSGGFSTGLPSQTLGQWYRACQVNANSASDRLQVGSNFVSGLPTGNAPISNYYFGADLGPSFFGNVEILLSVWMPGIVTSFPAVDAAVNALSPGTVQF